MFFHGGVSWAHAGFLGVDVFLVLSGFLITLLLLREIRATHRVAVKAFWLRRARRLIPALVLVLVAVALFGAFVATNDEALGLRGDLLGSLFYIQNWRLVLSGQPYFAQFGSPSPLRHMWSLAIEEQWYLIWPLVFLGIVRVAKANLKVIAAIVLSLAAASAGLMAVLYHPGGDSSRVYYGTDTRAQALLIGAALAVLFSMRTTPWTRVWTTGMQVVGGISLALLAYVVVTESENWTHLYRGGFTAVALGSAAVIAAAMTRGPVRTALSIPPLPQLGRISYGLYLWHWPVFVLLSPDRTGLDGTGLLVIRFAASIAIAVASYVLVERPIREQRFRWVRNRVAWVPATAALTALALILLTASGAAAKPRPNIFEEFRKRLNAPPLTGAARVLIAGDSIAFTLAAAPLPKRLQHLVWVRDSALIGCGIVTGTPSSNGVDGQSQDQCGTWPERYAEGVRKYKPQVTALLLGGWEVFDRTVDGKVLKNGTPEAEAYLDNRLDEATRVLTSGGAPLVLLTTPCFEVAQRDLGQFGEKERADPRRVDWLNGVWRRYAATHPTNVRLFDLNAVACPNGKYAESIDGLKMRTDGQHFSPEGGRVVWESLAPALHALAITKK